MKRERYRYLVTVSVKNLSALEDLLHVIFERDAGFLLVDLEERGKREACDIENCPLNDGGLCKIHDLEETPLWDEKEVCKIAKIFLNEGDD